MKWYAKIILLTILFFNGCTKIFLDKTVISSLTFPKTHHNLVIYFDKSFIVDEDGRLIIKTHSMLKIGEDLKTAPELFYVFDGSVEKLIDFNAKITHTDGRSKTYRKHDLLLQNLSNKQIISERKVRLLPIKEACGIGDLVEILSIHEQILPPLGISFSPAEIGAEAANITCSIQIPTQDSLFFQVVNDDLVPMIVIQEKAKIYCFEWKHYLPLSPRITLEKKNRYPQILASLPRCNTSYSDSPIAISSWKDYGDWYLELIAPKICIDEQTTELAKEITRNKITNKEKMDAIFDYCQKNIRYEQVYLEKGEFIPNDIRTILDHKYGDCKDYSTSIYVLARSIDLYPDLAFCFRGRGYEFYRDIPVNQFNHMIVHFNDNEKDYWYDATNRTGLAGITTTDLLNQTALVVKKSNSHLVTITESPENQLLVEGFLDYKNKGLVGDLKISLAAQYAIDLFYVDMYMNRADFIKELINWIKQNINKDIIIQAFDYHKEDQRFIIQARCELPNTVLEIEHYKFLSLNRIFNQLFPGSDQKAAPDRIFYYPYYNRLNIILSIANLYDPINLVAQTGFQLHYEYVIPIGPFDAVEKSDFLNKFNAIYQELNKTFKLITREAP